MIIVTDLVVIIKRKVKNKNMVAQLPCVMSDDEIGMLSTSFIHECDTASLIEHTPHIL
jgi:hypothetical protein